MKRKNSLYAFFSAAIIVIVIDFITKNLVDNFMAYAQKIVLLPNVLALEKVYNTGAAFSILQNNTAFLAAVSAITIAAILYFILTTKHNLLFADVIGLGFVTGGAFGNLADRLIFGHVIDFLQLEFINFPIFNFADVFINVGVIILLISIIFSKNDR